MLVKYFMCLYVLLNESVFLFSIICVAILDQLASYVDDITN